MIAAMNKANRLKNKEKIENGIYDIPEHIKKQPFKW